MWMGCTTAPVAGSGPCPTCRARVENPHSRGEPNSSPFMGRWPEGPEGLGLPASRPPSMRNEFEQIRPRDHRHRLPPIHHEHPLLAPQQPLARTIPPPNPPPP